MSPTPRLRVFAGPNGSGKSTVKAMISERLLGLYINPDDIEKEIRRFDFLNLQHYGIQTNQTEILSFFQQSPLIIKAELEDDVQALRFNDNKLIFVNVDINSYLASVAADFIRQKSLQSLTSFTFETVMSSPDKIELFKQAQSLGYRTYLYYIATDDPTINCSRVAHRVKMGGHPVPQNKIISRYHRSLHLLREAVRHTHRAYIFDNSQDQMIWIAEITNGHDLEFRSAYVPHWFSQAMGLPSA